MMKLSQLKLLAAAVASTAAAIAILGIATAGPNAPSTSAAAATGSAAVLATPRAATAPATASASQEAEETPAMISLRRARDLLAAAHQYSHGRKGRMPTTLAAVWKELPGSHRGLTADVAAFYFSTTDPRGGDLPKPITPAWLDANTSFAYLVGDLPNSIGGEKDLVVMHEKLDRAAGDGVVVAFANGVAGRVPKAEAEKLIERSKQRLAKVRPLKRYKGEPRD